MDPQTAAVFPRVWQITARQFEGEKLDLSYGDRGNWTGGQVGKGTLLGSKFGISAAAYPTLDIPNLTYDAAGEIARRDYWDAARCGELPPALAFLLFDAAFNSGVARAVQFLQLAVGVKVDGVFGDMQTMPWTRAWLAKRGEAALCAEVLAQRILFLSHAPEWAADGLGWSRRCAGLAFNALQFLPPYSGEEHAG